MMLGWRKSMLNQEKFTEEELWFLFTILSPGAIIGFRNPMLGLVANEIQDRTQVAIKSLLEKQVISFNNDFLEINSELRDSLIIVSSPTDSLLFGQEDYDSRQKKILSIHFSNQHAVLLEQQEGGLYSLQKVSSPKHILSLITDSLLLRIFWAPDSDSLYLKESCIKGIHEKLLKKNIEDARKQLMEVDGDSKTKIQLFEVLKSPKVSISLVGFYHRNDIQKGFVDGLTILVGERYLWLFELVDEKAKFVRASKVSLKELENRIDLKLPHMENAQDEI